jgi:hypothetical protein
MEDLLYNLIEALEASVKKNSEKPLTNLWLLNILKMIKKDKENDDGPSWGDLEF